MVLYKMADLVDFMHQPLVNAGPVDTWRDDEYLLAKNPPPCFEEKMCFFHMINGQVVCHPYYKGPSHISTYIT